MHIRKHPLKSSTIGTHREVVSFHFGPAGATRKVYVQSALHADEPPGLLVSQHLRERLSALEADNKLNAEIVLVPIPNPIGLAQWVTRSHIGRFELSTGENFNRHYADIATAVGDAVAAQLTQDESRNARLIRQAMVAELSRRAEAASSELESLRLALLTLACDAEIALDLHCDSEAMLHLYTGSPLWPRVEPLARYMQSVATLLETESGDNPFDEACSRTWWLLRERFGNQFPIPLGCVSVTVELRGTTDVSHDFAIADADAIVAYLQQQGLIAGTPPPMPALPHPATPLAGSAPIEAPISGVVVFLTPLGAPVSKGDAVVEVIDPLSNERRTLAAPVSGVLYARDTRRFAHVGMRLCKIAGAEAYRTGKLLSA